MVSFINDELESFSYVVSFRTLLLDGKEYLLFDKLTLHRPRQMCWKKVKQVHSCAHVNTPADLFNNIDTKDKSLFETHLSILASRRVASTLVTALYS
jgi:hypothetical protein